MPTRPATVADLDVVAEIYAHYVLISVGRSSWSHPTGMNALDRFVDTFLLQRSLS